MMLIEELVLVAERPHRVELFTVRSTGPADKALLIIHGGPDWDHSYLVEPLARLADERLLVFADLRGCGRSSTGLPDDAYTPEAAVLDLVALLDALGIERTDVLGFSYGGMLAQRLALDVPDRVRSLIVASSSIAPVPADAYADWPADELPTSENVWIGVTEPTPADTRADALASLPASVRRHESLVELRQRVDAIRFTAEWIRPFLAGSLPSARPDDAQRRLTELGLPILLLHGRQDFTFPATLAERAADEVHAARAVVLDEAGHMAHIDQPKLWLAAVAGFLDALDG